MISITKENKRKLLNTIVALINLIIRGLSRDIFNQRSIINGCHIAQQYNISTAVGDALFKIHDYTTTLCYIVYTCTIKYFCLICKINNVIMQKLTVYKQRNVY